MIILTATVIMKMEFRKTDIISEEIGARMTTFKVSSTKTTGAQMESMNALPIARIVIFILIKGIMETMGQKMRLATLHQGFEK